MAAHFTPETLRFLRGLKKNNDRAWFEERRPVYERALRGPLLALVEEINAGLDDVAPDHIRPPQKIAMRIFRDTRFSPDKRPYKTHLAAWWAPRSLAKDAGAGFYLDISPEGSFVGAGLYQPEREALLRLRRWLAEHHERYRGMLAAVLDGGPAPASMQPSMKALDPAALTRNPKGFPPEHPAGDLLRARNWGVTAPIKPEAVLAPTLGTEVLARFRQAAPLVHLLNEALGGGSEAAVRGDAQGVERGRPM